MHFSRQKKKKERFSYTIKKERREEKGEEREGGVGCREICEVENCLLFISFSLSFFLSTFISPGNESSPSLLEKLAQS